MKLKTKLVASIMSICLVFAVFAIGVFALRTANLKIGGDVSFYATGVEAHIKNTSLTGATTNQTLAASDAEGEVINTTMTQGDIDTTFATWQNLTLDFNENADDIVFKFNIVNTATKSDNYIEIDYDYTVSTENANVGVFAGDLNAEQNLENNNYILAPKGENPVAEDYETFTLKFRVLDKEMNVPVGTKINLSIFLKHITPVDASTSGWEIAYNEPATGEATLVSYTEPTNWDGKLENIPMIVKNNGNIYVVTKIGELAFVESTRIKSLVIPNSIKTIGGNAFCDCDNLASIVLGAAVIEGGGYFRACASLTNIVVHKGNPIYDSRNDCNAIIETSTNTLIIGSANTIIPYGITKLFDNAFNDCRGLTNIIIPNTVTSIGLDAFCSCESLVSIVIPDSVTSDIENTAFYNCQKLESITIGAGVTGIGKDAFGECRKLDSVYIRSQDVLSGLTSQESQGYLINSATKIYVKTGLNVADATYLTNTTNFTPEKIDDVVSDSNGDGYILYTAA